MVLFPDLSPAFPGFSPALPGAPRLVVGAPSFSEGWQERSPRVWYSPEIDASKFTLHILSDTPGGFLWLEYILLMKCTSEFTWSQLPSVSPKSLDHGIQVHFQTHSIMLSSFALLWPRSASPNGPDHDLQVLTIMASKCIPRLSWSRPPSSHNYDLHMHLPTHSSTASTSASVSSTQLPPSGAPRISLKHHLLPVKIYTVCRWIAL